MSNGKAERSHPRDLAGQVLRSVTALTGALAGGLGVAVPILAATFYEMKYGRPSSTAGLAIPFAVIWGGLAAGLGAAAGGGIRRMVARTRWAGPMDRRVASVLLSIVVAIPSLMAILAVRRFEAESAPRVVLSTGEIWRAEGRSERAPVQAATFLWASSPHPEHPPGELRWNSGRVEVRIADDQLRVWTHEIPTTSIDIARFDYAREAYGVTAAPLPDGQEWLALLVQLRATGRRELLLIFDPEGVLVHEELLERHGRVPRVGLGAAGPAGGPQEIVVDRGMPIRYYLGVR